VLVGKQIPPKLAWTTPPAGTLSGIELSVALVQDVTVKEFPTVSRTALLLEKSRSS
jgi:hypothetical protein